MELVREVGSSEGDWDSDDIGRGRKDLGVPIGIAESAEDCGDEVGKCVRGHRAAHEEEREGPDLGVNNVLEEERPGKLLKLGVSTVLIDPILDEVKLFLVKELVLSGLVGEVDND